MLLVFGPFLHIFDILNVVIKHHNLGIHGVYFIDTAILPINIDQFVYSCVFLACQFCNLRMCHLMHFSQVNHLYPIIQSQRVPSLLLWICGLLDCLALIWNFMSDPLILYLMCIIVYRIIWIFTFCTSRRKAVCHKYLVLWLHKNRICADWINKFFWNVLHRVR